jgi:galactokinase
LCSELDYVLHVDPQVIAAVIAGALTVIGTLAAQYSGRRATSKDAEKALGQQREQLIKTFAEQREQLDKTLRAQGDQLDKNARRAAHADPERTLCQRG